MPPTFRVQFCSSLLLYQVDREVPTCAPISAESTLPHWEKGIEDAMECWEKTSMEAKQTLGCS